MVEGALLVLRSGCRYPAHVGGMIEGQKERFSRAFIVAAACAAADDFTCQVHVDDIEGVDVVVRQQGVAVDFQLKSTIVPEETPAGFVYDLDVRTYNMLTPIERSGMAVLALIVLGTDTASWCEMTDDCTRLTHCAYYLTLHGMEPTSNTATIRLTLPKSNVLNPEAMRQLMKASRGRFTTT